MHNSEADCTRRGFLAAVLSGLISAGMVSISPGEAFAQKTKRKKGTSKKDIIYRKLGKTGLKLPIVSMGVMNANNPGVVKASYEIGIRHFDTAAYYQYGRNEQMVGSVIKQLGVRDKVVIATKVFAPGQRSDCSPEEAKRKIVEIFEGSLNRLQMDYVDILYIHNVQDAETPGSEAIIEAMTGLKKQGKARFIGVTTHTNMTEVIHAAVKTGVYDVVLTSINFTMADDEALLEAIENAAAKGVGVIAMKTLAGGGRGSGDEAQRQYSGSTITKAALKWVLHNENITTAIPGYTIYEHMEEDFSVASDFAYTSEEEKFLADNNVKVSMGFCRQCRTCVATCPLNVDIPNLMRTHMYVARYSNFYEARATLDEIPRERGLSACRSCTMCTARCARTIDIAQRIGELKLMYM